MTTREKAHAKLDELPEERLEAALAALEAVEGKDTSWKAMLGEGERDATEEEIAVLEAEHGPFLPPDGEG